MTTKTKLSMMTVGLSVLLSVILSSAFTYHVTNDALNRDKQFKVVDIRQLTTVMMSNLEESIRGQEIQLSEEMIQVVAENEARKLYTTIANTGGTNDIIIPKSSVLYSPERYEITANIAAQLGLEGVVNKNLKEELNAKSPSKG